MENLENILLCIDVGNSNITLALMKDSEVIKRYRMKSKVNRTSDEFGMRLMGFLNSDQIRVDQIEGVIISSVVPKIMHSLTNAIRKFIKCDPMVLGSHLKYPIEIGLENPQSVGADRIADCIGVLSFYEVPALVVDFGTATTYDYLDEKGCFSSGAISVGIESGANALWSQTAQLPEIEIRKPETILAKNTATEMQAGIFYQFLGGFEKTVDVYRKATGQDFKVIVTGGLGRVICPYTDQISTYDPNLLFKGLSVIYKYNKENNDD